MKKFFKGTLKFAGKLTVGIAIFLSICFAINGIGSLLTNRVEKKRADRDKLKVTNVDTNQKELSAGNFEKVEKQENNAQIVKDDKNIDKNDENIKRVELESKYIYVGSPISMGDKKYFPVRVNGNTGYGLVDYETLQVVISPDKYDAIGAEKEIADKSYVTVSVPNDDSYAYGLVSLDTYEEIIPTATYRKTDYNDTSVECLQTDRETVDVYLPDENTQILTKKLTK